MTKSTITRERLEKIKSWRETYGAGSNVILPAEEAEELARIALAAMDGEPAMYVMGMGQALDAETASTCKGAVDSWVAEWNQSRLPGQTDYKTVPLYRHAQPAPVVPEEMTPQQASRSYGGEVRGYRDGWNACRAAMLQAGDAVRDLSTPVDPQVAEYEQNVMQAGSSPVIPDGYVMVPKEPTGKQWAAGVQAFDSGMDKVTRIYKAMLSAAPQEVQGE